MESERAETPLTCPYCGDNVPHLHPIESGMKLLLKDQANINPVPDAVCDGCFSMMEKMMSQGATLRAEKKAKENNRLMLWKSRVELVKTGKNHMDRKNYTAAAAALEKYIRVLEICYDRKPGDLTPDLFRNEKRAQELTVVSAVYWDLMRAYDSNPRYAERQSLTAEKLAAFVRFSPIYPHIMRKAESQARKAKNPEPFRKFLKLAGQSRPRCFIATAAFDGYFSPTVESLCQFRDQVLKKRASGRFVVWSYYRISPHIASALDRNPRLKPIVRRLLTRLADSRIIKNRLNP